MTVYSWNVFFRTKTPKEALTFIRDSGADIFCLQEVPSEMLDELFEMYPHHAYAVEMDRLVPEGTMQIHSVILSRYPIRGSGAIALVDFADRIPPRTKAFIRLMRPLGWSHIRNRNAVYADIEGPSGLTRIICIHLTLSNPLWRLEEFEKAMLERDRSIPTIVCGDFNILERPHITPINWLSGGRISDVLLYRRERTTIEKRFLAHELMNPLRSMPTHGLSGSQLDHILVSRSLAVRSAAVIPELYGSDHHPVRVEVG